MEGQQAAFDWRPSAIANSHDITLMSLSLDFNLVELYDYIPNSNSDLTSRDQYLKERRSNSSEVRILKSILTISILDKMEEKETDFHLTSETFFKQQVKQTNHVQWWFSDTGDRQHRTPVEADSLWVEETAESDTSEGQGS